MLLYVARHGETEFNKEDILQGLSDSQLTESGKLHAKKLAEYAKNNKITKIFSSPLKRAKETAQVVSEKNNISIFFDNRLREICYGSWDGLKKKDIKKDTRMALLWQKREENKFSFVHPGKFQENKGESYEDAQERVVNFVKALENEEQNNKEKEGSNAILIIAHLGISRNIYKHYKNCSQKEAVDFSPKNNQVLVINTMTHDVSLENVDLCN